MKVLKTSAPFYNTVLKHFRKQYKDVERVTRIRITAENQVCAGEWIDSEGNICISDSVDAVRTVEIIEDKI